MHCWEWIETGKGCINDFYKGSAYLYDTLSILLGVFTFDNQIFFIDFLYLFLSLFFSLALTLCVWCLSVLSKNIGWPFKYGKSTLAVYKVNYVL